MFAPRLFPGSTNPRSESLFLLECAKGNVPGHIIVTVFGCNASIENASTYEDIWTGGTTTDWEHPTEPRTHDIVSTSTNDTLGGSGAEKIHIEGLNDRHHHITEDVTLNGTTDVPTAHLYVAINLMTVHQSADGANSSENAGVITATAQTDATVTSHMSIGHGRTLSTIYTVPDHHKAYLIRSFGGLAGKATADAIIRMWSHPEDEPWQMRDLWVVRGDGMSFLSMERTCPLVFPERSTIKFDASSDTNSTEIAAGYDLCLIDDDEA